jgi:hypothetical protein
MKLCPFSGFEVRFVISFEFLLILKDEPMADDVTAPDVNEREEKIQRAIALVKHRNFERYGIFAADERDIRSQPDWRLDRIIDPSLGLPPKI